MKETRALEFNVFFCASSPCLCSVQFFLLKIETVDVVSIESTLIIFPCRILTLCTYVHTYHRLEKRLSMLDPQALDALRLKATALKNELESASRVKTSAGR